MKRDYNYTFELPQYDLICFVFERQRGRKRMEIQVRRPSFQLSQFLAFDLEKNHYLPHLHFCHPTLPYGIVLESSVCENIKLQSTIETHTIILLSLLINFFFFSY